MKTLEMNQVAPTLTEKNQSVMMDTSVSYATELSYNEMAEIPVSRTTAIEQLRANISQLEDISERMKFMTREIRYLMKV